MENIILESDKCFIKAAFVSDIDNIRSVAINSSSHKTFGDLYDEICIATIKETISEGTVFWIYTKENAMCGFIELHKPNGDNIRELGIEIFEEYRNKGIGTESILLFTDYLYQNKDINSLKLRIAPDNERCIHVFEKLGAVSTGAEWLFPDLKEAYPDNKYVEFDVLGYVLSLPIKGSKLCSKTK